MILSLEQEYGVSLTTSTTTFEFELGKELTLYEDCSPTETDCETRIVDIVDMTHEEEIQMYMKASKKELCEMLIEANKHLRNLSRKI